MNKTTSFLPPSGVNKLEHSNQECEANSKARFMHKRVKSQTPNISAHNISSPTEQLLKSLKSARKICKTPGNSKIVKAVKSSTPPSSISSQLKMYWYDGHASIVIHDQGGAAHGVGFYPSDTWIFDSQGKLEKENYLKEAISEEYPVLSIDLSSDQTSKLKSQINAFSTQCTSEDEACSYHPLTFNCFDFAQKTYRWADQEGHWLDHIPSSSVVKKPGLLGAYVLMFKKPYLANDSISSRGSEWINQRLEGFQSNPSKELQGNFYLFGACAFALYSAYLAVKTTATFTLNVAKSSLSQKTGLNKEELIEFFEKAVAGMDLKRKSIDYIFDYSEENKQNKLLRSQQSKVIIDATNDLENLKGRIQTIKKTDRDKISEYTLIEMAKSIEKLSDRFIKICNTVGSPVLLGSKIQGNIKTIRRHILQIDAIKKH